jgi:hypothetical protein
MKVRPTCYRFGLRSNDTGLPQTTTITPVTAGALSHFGDLNQFRLLPSFHPEEEFSVSIQFQSSFSEPKRAMEFARCIAANRHVANNSGPTSFMGKVVSHENPHCIRYSR